MGAFRGCPQSLCPPLRRLFRASICLKSTLYTLSLLVLSLVILALHAGVQLSRPAGIPRPKDIPFTAIEKLPADTGVTQNPARGNDTHLLTWDPQRSFEEPDFALLSGLQPSQIGCDVPLMGEGEKRTEEGVLLFLGIFSAADKKGRRDLFRRVIIPEFPHDTVTVKFILASPPLPQNPISREAVDRSLKLREIEAEMRQHGDMVALPIIDNIDAGKTYEYLRWVAKEYAGDGRAKGRPRFVMLDTMSPEKNAAHAFAGKLTMMYPTAHTQTILVMPNITSAFQNLDCSENVYWGTSAGRSHHFKEYFRGLAYALSWPLVSWIGSADLPYAHVIKVEDARTAQWLQHLDPVVDPVRRIDMGWTMGDYNQLDITKETVALHWVKTDESIIEQHDNLLSVWAAAGRNYSPDHGVPSRDSIYKGKVLPKGAAEEHQRQKDLGWDVQGNINR